jgi:hypothetical protein
MDRIHKLLFGLQKYFNLYVNNSKRKSLYNKAFLSQNGIFCPKKEKSWYISKIYLIENQLFSKTGSFGTVLEHTTLKPHQSIKKEKYEISSSSRPQNSYPASGHRIPDDTALLIKY